LTAEALPTPPRQEAQVVHRYVHRSIAAFLSPLVRSFTLSIKSPEQIAAVDSPVWPASGQTYTYRDRDYPVYQVPLDSETTPMALVKKGRDSSQFVDPANPDAGLVTWQGSWRTLEPVWQFDPHWENYVNVWNEINYPRLLFNTIAIALISMTGPLSRVCSSPMGSPVSDPRSRRSVPLVIATIFLPGR
jgi:multiple sugar transport system permease protein